MKRFLIAASAVLAGGLTALAGPASARVIELGQTPAIPAPTCIGKDSDKACRAITKTTFYPFRYGTVTGPTVVPADGRIVAVTVRLGKLTRKQLTFFARNYGGTPRMRVTVLQVIRRLERKAVRQSAEIRLQPYLGKTVQIPLGRTLAVKKGNVVALSVPTYAPMLATPLPTDNVWRTSRASNACDLLAVQTALIPPGTSGNFGCSYTGGRPTYSVTLVTLPKPPPVTFP